MALTHALTGRLREVLPSPEYDVAIKGLAVTIHRRGYPGSAMGIPAAMLAVPGSLDEKLNLVLEMIAEMAKHYVSPGALSQVRVTSDLLAVWWGSATEEDAIARLRPILRKEIGL
jgi:hypothetical protein